MADDSVLPVKADVKADLTEAATHATRKMGELVDDARSGTRPLLGPLSELWGWGTDAIAEHRRRSHGKMCVETDRILHERGVETTRELPPAALPQLAERRSGTMSSSRIYGLVLLPMHETHRSRPTAPRSARPSTSSDRWKLACSSPSRR